MRDDFASALELQITDEFGGRALTELARDPHTAHWLGLFDKSSGSQIQWGQVVDVIPFVNAYRVCTGPRSYIWCADSGVAGFQPFGARPLNTIPIGSLVFFLTHPQTPWYGTIFAAEPPPLLRNQYFRADYIWPGSRSGIRVEQAHQLTLQSQAGAGGVENHSCGRPIDQTSLGEWGAITETGLAVYLDAFMAYLRADEATGFFVFLHDALARLAGHNLQIRSSVREKEDLDDESEIIHRAGSAIHFWELLGRFTPGTGLTRSYTATQVQGSNPEYSTLEPAYDDQQAFFRLQKAEGYLGQGGKRTLCLPPTSGGPINRYSTEAILPGVFEESLSAAGAYMLSAAGRIMFAKRPCIPIPKEIHRPEDEAGDTASNYNASGGMNANEAHIVVDWPTVAVKISSGTQAALTTLAAAVSGAASGSAAAAAIEAESASITSTYPNLAGALDRLVGIINTYPSDVVPHLPALGAVITRLASTHPTTGNGAEPPSNQVSAAALCDIGAFDFNHTHDHPYAYHPLDYYFPEESSQPVSSQLLLPNFTTLQTNQYLPTPSATEIPIDHRYGVSRIFPNVSYFTMLDDGGIVLRDGYGAEIKLAGGAIELNAPGDIWVKSGKNVNVWAGRDAIIRAQHSVDMTAANQDVHIKAENNVMVLAGNNGCGGVEIESRATCAAYDYTEIGEQVITTGIILKAQQAQVTAWGRDVILWADPGDTETKGHIVLNSGNRIKEYCQYHERFIQVAAIDYFTDTSGDCSFANEYWPGETLFTSDVLITGKLVSGCHWVDGGVMVTNGHIATDQSNTYNNLVAVLEGTNLTNATATQAQVAADSAALIATASQEFDLTWQDVLTGSLGTATFSLRDTGQYMTESLILFESYWQQLARLDSQSLPTWNEPAVTVLPAGSMTTVDTYPHPGLGPWTGTDEEDNPVYAYYQQDLDLYDVTGGEGGSIPRVANRAHYETPVIPRPDALVFSGNYSTIISS